MHFLSVYMLSLLLSVGTLMHAMDGTLDTTFDGDGKVTTPIGTSTDQARSIAIQTDGKIIAAGFSNNGTNNDFALVRYNPDGSLDTTFNPTGPIPGIVTTPIGSGNDFASAVAIQADGKIIAAGSSFNTTTNNFDFALVRYNPDGSLDTTFDGDGIVTTPIGSGNDFASAVAIQADGKIVVAGSSFNTTTNNFDFALVRYNPDGSLDTTFDTDGKVTTPIGTGNDFASAVAIQADGKIVVAGSSFNTTTNNFDFALARYNTDGSLDTTFDTDGKVTTPIGSGNDQANAVAIQADGKIIAAGNSDIGTNTDFALVRYNPDGSLDTTFDGDGKVITPIGTGNDFASAVAIQADGKIIAAGFSNNGANDDFALARYSVTGQPLDATVIIPATIVTTDTTPTITGTAQNLSNVGFLVDGVFRGGTFTQLNTDPGAFTFTFTDPLPLGTYTIQAVANYFAGKVNILGMATLVVTTAPTITLASSATAVCAGTSVTLTSTVTNGTAPFSYSLLANGTATGTTNSTGVFTVTPTATTTFSVTVTDANNLSATSNSVIVTVNTAPSVSLTAQPTTINAGQSSTLTATTSGGTAPFNYSLLANGTATGVTNTTGTFTVSPTTSTNYVVQVTDANGCTGTSNALIITVAGTLLVTGTANPSTVCSGQPTTLTVSVSNGSAPFTYTFSDGFTVTTSDTTVQRVVRPSLFTIYTVTVTDSTGSSTTVTVPVNVILTLRQSLLSKALQAKYCNS